MVEIHITLRVAARALFLCTKPEDMRTPSLPSPLYFTTVRKLTTVRNPTTAGLFSV